MYFYSIIYFTLLLSVASIIYICTYLFAFVVLAQSGFSSFFAVNSFLSLLLYLDFTSLMFQIFSFNSI